MEIQKYLSEEKISRTGDPLSYWKGKSTSSPSLTEMAKVYLAVPRTSAPSERAFLLGRLLMPYTRTRLTAELSALMCLKSWSKQNII